MRYHAFKALNNFSNLEVRLGTATLIPYSTMIFTKLRLCAICNHPHGRKPQRWASCVDPTSRGRWLQALVQEFNRQHLTFSFCLYDSCYSPPNKMSKARKKEEKVVPTSYDLSLTRKRKLLFPTPKDIPQWISGARNCHMPINGYMEGWKSQYLAGYKMQVRAQ